jgi:hypothetical protein
MRIGTWNLAGRWSDSHERLLHGLDCDVLLLTEVRRDVEMATYERRLTRADMADGRAWAGIYSRTPLERVCDPRCSLHGDPHPASVLARSGGVTYCSSILPWRGARSVAPWTGHNAAAKTEATVAKLGPHLTAATVWGGDFNHAMTGPEHAGSKAGRGHVQDLLRTLGLRVPTTHLAHRIPGLLSIDHVAVPNGSVVSSASRTDATGLSDHDAYVVTLS